MAQGYSDVHVLQRINAGGFAHRPFFPLLAGGLFSCSLGSGARREPARTPRRKCGPWPRSVARALGVQSREHWQLSTGRHSEHVEPPRPMQTRVRVKTVSDEWRMHMPLACYALGCIICSVYPLATATATSSRTSMQQQQALLANPRRLTWSMLSWPHVDA